MPKNKNQTNIKELKKFPNSKPMVMKRYSTQPKNNQKEIRISNH
jgi:hypothetical protein